MVERMYAEVSFELPNLLFHQGPAQKARPVEQGGNFPETSTKGTKNEQNSCAVVTCNQNSSKGE